MILALAVADLQGLREKTGCSGMCEQASVQLLSALLPAATYTRIWSRLQVLDPMIGSNAGQQ
jgi:hypothetical protein